MPPLPSRLSQLAAAVADGEPVDWASVESTLSDPHDRVLLQRLRVVAEVTDLHLTGTLAGESLSLELKRFSDSSRRTLAPGTMWGHLKVLECVGRGRFGVVYRAWDPRLEREVALKLLDRGIASDDSEVIHEGRLMARIHHANVTAIYGAESRDGQTGLWMQFIEGRTLEAELRANGVFSADALRQVGSELCDALAAVHRAGLVHRDVKPQNVLRDPSGRVILGDFGTGRFSGDALTGVAGTPLYLASEVIDGAEATEQSDIYALGVLLFHLATDSYPVFARTIAEMRDAHESRPRISLVERRPDLAGPIADAIDCALCPNPALRPATTNEFKTALTRTPASEHARDPVKTFSRSRWMIGAAAMVLIVTAVAWTSWPARELRPAFTPLEARPWVLISAFDNRTGDAELNQVLESALQRELVESAQFRVASRSRVDDVLRLMRRPVDVPLDAPLAREIALRDGGIRLVIAGSVERVGPQIVLSASILDVDSGTAIASLVEEAGAPDGLQLAIRRLSNALRLRLGETDASIRRSSKALERVTTPSLHALRLYSESYSAGERDQWPAALNLVRAAVHADTTFAAAHTWLAWCLFRNQVPSHEYVEAATIALDLSANASEPERLWIAGSYHELTRNVVAARSAYEALLRMYPDHYWAANNLVLIHRRAGRDAEALEAAKHLLELRPQDHNSLQLAFDGARRLKQFDLAADYAHRIRTLGLHNRQPGGEPWVFDAVLAWDRGQPEAQIQELRKVENDALKLDPELRDAVLARTAMSWLAAGRPSDALAMLRTAAPTTDRRLTHATIAHAIGDRATAAREALTTEVLDVPAGGTNTAEVRQWALALWIVSRTADTATVNRFYRRLEPAARRRAAPQGPAITNVLAAESANARGETEQVVRYLAPQEAWNNLWDLTNFQAAETLADALVTGKDPQGAVRELEEALSLKHPAAFDAAYWQMRCQLRLAELYQQLGKQSEAQAIARELEQKLGHAEPGFPLAERVATLLHHAPSPNAGSAAGVPALDAPARAAQARRLFSSALGLMNGPPPWPNHEAELLLRDAVRHDPDFAAAHIMLAHALRYQGRPWAEYMETAKRAEAAEQAASPSERPFIEGSLIFFRSEGASNDEEWRSGLENAAQRIEQAPLDVRDRFAPIMLINLYVALGREADLLRIRILEAERLPQSVIAQSWVAIQFFRNGRFDDAAPYIARASALAAAAPAAENAFHVAWLRLVPAHRAWFDNRPADALAATNVVASAPPVEALGSTILSRQLFGMYAALGRLKQAGVIAAEAHSAQERDDLQMALLTFHDDRDAMQALIRSRYMEPRDALRIIWLSIPSKLLEPQLRQLVKENKYPEADSRLFAAGRLALLEGRVDEAIAMLNSATLRHEEHGISKVMSIATVLADAWIAKGNRVKAIQALESATAPRSATLFGANTGALWLKTRAKLATLYRETGRETEANEIDRLQARLLSEADEDHPLLKDSRRSGR